MVAITINISENKAAFELEAHDNFYILTHEHPDGDTLGSACALLLALKQRGKKAKILCSDTVPGKYDFMFKNLDQEDFKCSYVVTVDVADEKLLGTGLTDYCGKIDMCIDHHPSNKNYAEYTLLNSNVASAAEIVYNVILALGVQIDKDIAACLYTGISTDTGCFKFSNVKPSTHIKAAALLSTGIDAASINKAMFDRKSKSSVMLESMALSTLKTYFDGKCAIIYISKDMMNKCSAEDSDTDGIVAITRKIDGVEVGILIKEKERGVYKVSMRTNGDVSACNICKHFGGGGHFAASGCTIEGTLDEVIQKILEELKKELI